MNRELRNRVSAIAKEVRAWAEKIEAKGEFPDMGLCGWCGICAAELYARLKLVGILSEIHVSTDSGSHAYTVVDDHIVDVTATQFCNRDGQTLVIIHSKEAEHLWYYQTSEIFSTATKFRAWQLNQRWPKRQTAFSRVQTKPKELLTA